MPRLLCALLSLLAASSASAVTMAWTPIGDPGNPADTQVMQDGTTGYGSVPYAYHIGTYEVTNAAYAEFLNAKAVSDPLLLYNPSMGTISGSNQGGITRSGSDGSYTYSVIPGRGSFPVIGTTFYHAMRFANWMNNGQGSGDTESGAYTLLGGTPIPSNGTTVTRNASATIAVPSEDEWYKAAYFDALSVSYFDYPTGFDVPPACTAPTALPNHANCGHIGQQLEAVGSYTGSASPYGSFDQGGNLAEWNEAILSTVGPGERGMRGFAFVSDAQYLAAGFRGAFQPGAAFGAIGFRLAMIPEPSTGLLVIAGLISFGGWRRATR